MLLSNAIVALSSVQTMYLPNPSTRCDTWSMIKKSKAGLNSVFLDCLPYYLCINMRTDRFML